MTRAIKLEWDIRNADSSLYKQYFYIYDDKGNKVEIKALNPNGSVDHRTTYKFDDNGDPVEVNSYKSGGSIPEFKMLYTYDNEGNSTELRYFDPDGKLGTQSAYKYEYDKTGNWIKRTEFNKDIPHYVIEREIEYY